MTSTSQSNLAGQAASVLPFQTWRRRGWLDRKLSGRRLAEALEWLPDFIAEVEGRR